MHKNTMHRPFGPRNLQEVYDRIRTENGLTQRQRAEYCSAINSLARMANSDLIDLPTDPRLLRQHMDHCAAARHKLSHARHLNIRSLVLKSLQISGVRIRTGRSRIALPPIWQSLLEQLPEKPFRVSLSAFSRWCVEEKLNPEDVDQHVFESYERILANCSIRLTPRQSYLATCRAWNNAHKYCSGWPSFRVQVFLRNDNQYVLEWSSFAPSFKANVERMICKATKSKIHNADDLMSPVSRKPIRPETAKNRRKQIRRIASALALSGRDPKEITCIADLTEPEAACTALKFLLERSENEPKIYIHHTAILIHTLAKQYVKVSEGKLEQLKRICINTKISQDGMTRKNREMLRLFENKTLLNRLLNLPGEIFREFSHKNKLNNSAALRLQSALAVELLTVTALRIKNLSSIRLHHNLIKIEAGSEKHWYLHFPAGEVKNEVELDRELPTSSICLLEFYLQMARPLLCYGPNFFLFPNRKDGPKLPVSFGRQIQNFLNREIGIELTSHQFRHLSGCLYLKENPDAHEAVRQFLGHKSITTTIRYYTDLQSADAIRRYDDLIERHRNEG